MTPRAALFAAHLARAQAGIAAAGGLPASGPGNPLAPGRPFARPSVAASLQQVSRVFPAAPRRRGLFG